MPRELRIAKTLITDESPCYVVAEVGHNHQGNIETCKQLFRKAKDCGCDAVKLQKRDNRTYFTKATFDAPYQNRNSYGPTYGEHREFLEFDREQFAELRRFCSEELDIDFFATAFDIPSADLLEELDMPAYKIASGDIVNMPLVTHVARFGKPMILSTGGAHIEDVVRAYETVRAITPHFAILQCTSGYPPSFEELNLRVIEDYRKRFPDIIIGYSGHENGISMPVAAYVLGARIVEKHFTLERTWKGTDQALSLAPTGMGKMVRDFKRVHVALGRPEKRRLSVEEASLVKMSKSLVAMRPLSAGTVLSLSDIACKVPNTGLPPYRISDLVGKTLSRDMETDEPFSFADVSDENGAGSRPR